MQFSSTEKHEMILYLFSFHRKKNSLVLYLVILCVGCFNFCYQQCIQYADFLNLYFNFKFVKNFLGYLHTVFMS